MNERTFQGAIERLRSPERVARLEVARVVGLALDRLEAQNVLDVGTGTGLFAEGFLARGLQVTGVDFSEAMLEAARNLVPGASFVPGAMESLPFPDASFDLVFLGFVLHEAEDLTGALREARRVARHRVIVAEWPYQAEEAGPPLAHRLTALQVEKTALEVGFHYTEVRQLDHVVVYRLACL